MILNHIVWEFDPVLLNISSFSLRWYSVLMALGFYLGYLTMRKIFILENIPAKTVDSFGIFLVLGLFIGGRLVHCLFYETEYYLQFPLDIIKPWRGALGNGAVYTGIKGMASHGGVLGVIIGVIINARIKKLPVLWTLDRFAIVVVLAGIFIRIGNLFNSEILGIQTSLPWAFVFARVSNIPKHPVQLYEAITYMLIFLISYNYYLKNRIKLKNGELLGLVLLLVFVSRFFFEYIKDSQTVSDAFSLLKMGQLLSIPFILVGVFLFFRNKKIILNRTQIRSWSEKIISVLILLLLINIHTLAQSIDSDPLSNNLSRNYGRNDSVNHAIYSIKHQNGKALRLFRIRAKIENAIVL